MAFSLSNAMSGAGGAVADVAGEFARTEINKNAQSELLKQRGAQEESLLQKRAAIEDMRLQRERDRLAKVGNDAEAARTGPAYDPATDSTRPQTPAEAAAAAASVYSKNGMIAEAMRTREFEDARAGRAEDRLDRRIDRTADNERADRQLAATERHQRAMEGLQAASNKRLESLTKIQEEAAQLDLDTKKELKVLQDAYAKETDPTKRATLERNILTRLGKAKELPEPVKAYVDTVKSELTAYAKAEAEGSPLSPQVVQRRAELQQQMMGLATTGTIAPIKAGVDNKGRPPLGSFMQGQTQGAPAAQPAAPAPTLSQEDRAVQSMSRGALVQAAEKPDAIGAAAKRRLAQIQAQEADSRARTDEAVQNGFGFGTGGGA